MATLDTLLARPGLRRSERLLALAETAIAPADWQRLADCVRRARQQSIGRALLEETLLQAVLFFGFPRIVSAFEVMQREWPVQQAPAGGGLPPEQQARAGRKLFEAIYARNAPVVRAMLRAFHAEFHDFVLDAAYGRILTRPALAPRLRELLAVAALAALDQPRQLVAHARGALAFGATPQEIAEAAFSALEDPQAVARLMLEVAGRR